LLRAGSPKATGRSRLRHLRGTYLRRIFTMSELALFGDVRYPAVSIFWRACSHCASLSNFPNRNHCLGIRPPPESGSNRSRGAIRYQTTNARAAAWRGVMVRSLEVLQERFRSLFLSIANGMGISTCAQLRRISHSRVPNSASTALRMRLLHTNWFVSIAGFSMAYTYNLDSHYSWVRFPAGTRGGAFG